MPLDPVPWMVTGGEHSAEVGRTLAYIACGGTEGVVATGDFKVRASSVPDGNIHVQPGAAAVLNRFPGGGQQAYVVRNASDTVVAMTPQGSSGPRYDLVAVIVEDPEYPGQPDPADIASGPYVRIAVYTDVDPDTRTLAEVDPDQSGYALARVKFDASDGTVVANDITDLRGLLNPKSSTSASLTALSYGGGSADVIALNDPVPAAGTIDVAIPAWCNRISFTAQVSNLVLGDLDTAGVAPAGSGALQLNLGVLASAAFPLTINPAQIATVDPLYASYYPSPAVAGAKFALFGVSDPATGQNVVTLTWNVDIPPEMRNTIQPLNAKLSARTGIGAGQEFWVFPNAQLTATALMQQSMDSVY